MEWYLIQSKPKQQLRAIEQLENQGVSCFCPMITIEKVIRGKRQSVSEPLFSNYLFIELSSDDINWSKIRSTRGVRDFVRFGTEVAKVPKSLIEQVRIDTADIDPNVIDSNAPKSGEKVKVTEGVFKGLEGIYKAKNGEERSFVLLNILNKPVSMDISNKDMHKV